MICPTCKKDRGYASAIPAIETLGMCEHCYAEKQPPVKTPSGSYLPWKDVFSISYEEFDDLITVKFNKRGEEDMSTAPLYEELCDRTMPKISVCKDTKKFKITYMGKGYFVNGDNVIKVERYFDTMEQLLGALGVPDVHSFVQQEGR